MYERIFEKRVKVRVRARDSARSESACVRVLLIAKECAPESAQECV